MKNIILVIITAITLLQTNLFFTNLHHENLYKDCDIEGTHLNGSAIPTFDF